MKQNEIEVKIVCKSKHGMPKKGTKLSSGYDVKANIDKPVVVEPFSTVLIPTGLYLQLPPDYEAQMRGRSGFALRNGIQVVLGTIDADYVGQCGVIVYNSSNKPFIVADGMRIAQLIFAKRKDVEFNEVDFLESTERGAGGFGSTGI